MFTVKQEAGSGHSIWPGIRHVSAQCLNTAATIDVVFCQFEGGGELRFDASGGKNTIYVMNEAGATVARYDLGFRVGLLETAGLPASALVEPEAAKLAA